MPLLNHGTTEQTVLTILAIDDLDGCFCKDDFVAQAKDCVDNTKGYSKAYIESYFADYYGYCTDKVPPAGATSQASANRDGTAASNTATSTSDAATNTSDSTSIALGIADQSTIHLAIGGASVVVLFLGFAV
ncbi:hypothetical protein BBP40_005972 [Aspergillus hancockii]|nr:hypothetical protein BBP40_005972 [Aspergillus hancockii]